MIKSYLRKNLSENSKRKLRNLAKDIKASFSGGDLNTLGRIYGTDKFEGHYYTPHYETHLQRFKFRNLNLLEIGVGDYANPLSGGHSLRMWKKYFPAGKIFAIDIYDKSALQESRIKIFKGSQVDKNFLNEVTNAIGEIDIIIDDGSHINAHVIETFKLLFPKLKDGGIYVVEDTQTSYWAEHFGGDNQNFNNPATMMSFFKGLADGLNYREYKIAGYQPTYFDQKVISMHFYHNLIFIYKGDNDDKLHLVVH